MPFQELLRVRSVQHVEQRAFDGGVSHRGFPGCVDCRAMDSISTALPTLPKAASALFTAVVKLATRTRRIQLDEETRAEQEAPHQQEPSPQMMAEDSATTRPTEGVRNRSEPIEMAIVYKRLRSPFCLPSRRWIRWGCSGAGGTWRRRERA